LYILFFIFSFLILCSAGLIIFIKNLIQAALLLIICLVCIAGIFILENADFLAIAQIMIYVGGVLVLVLFGIMLIGRNLTSPFPTSLNRSNTLGIIVTIIIFGALSVMIKTIDYDSLGNSTTDQIKSSTVEHIGVLIMTRNIVAFEIAGILLMVTLMGATLIANKNILSTPNIDKEVK
jgi:NADH-quinone oxidoreductase subunit J